MDLLQIGTRVTQEPLSNLRLVMPLAMAAPAADENEESSEEEPAPVGDGVRALLSALLAPLAPFAAKEPPTVAALMRRLCARAPLPPPAARLCARFAALDAPPEPQEAYVSEEREPPSSPPSPCSLLAALLQARGKSASGCPLCALLHATAHAGEAHAAHECPLCSALATPSSPAPAPAAPRAPRALVLWLNPHSRRDWNVLRENVPGE